MPELVGLARTMRALAAPVSERAATDLVDTAGTGGGPSTFNVSTTAALVAAGAGCAVAKHGNRSNTSKCGSADLLEALGVNIELEPEQVGRCIDEVGFGFMFAPTPPRGDGARDPGPQGARGADDLQLPRPADQPGRRQPAAARGRRPPLPGDDRRGAGRPRQRAGAGRLRRGRPRRALALRADPGDRGRRRRHRGVVRRAGPVRPRAGRAGGGRRRDARRRTPPSRARCWPASRARAATWSCSTPPRRSTSAASPPTSRRASPRPPRRSTPARQRNVLERLIAATAARRRLGSGGSSGNDRAADRRGPAGSRGASPRAPAGRPRSRASPAAARIAPSTRRWCAPASR